MATLFAWAKLALPTLIAMVPLARRIKSERDAGINPHTVPKAHADDLLDGALKRLGSVSNDDSLWDKFIQYVGATIVRPSQFSKPHVRNWLSRPDVIASLKRLAKAQLVSAPEPQSDRDLVLSAYVEISGERVNFAEDMLSAAVTFLKASLQGAVRDPGLEAIAEAGFASLLSADKANKTKFDEITAALKVPMSGAVAEHHGLDAKNALKAILRRRASPGQDPLAELRELGQALENEGKFALASPSIKAQIYDWTARIAANKGNLVAMDEALAKLAQLGSTPSLVAQAWSNAARGNIDAALRLLHTSESPEDRSNTFGLLRAKRGTEAALAYFDLRGSVDASTFTPVGWMNVVSSLAEKGRMDQAITLLSSLPGSMYVEFPILGYVQGVICTSKFVSDELRERVIREEYLAASNHLLDGDAADIWRKKARESFELSHRWAEDADDCELANQSANWLRWLRIIDPKQKEAELSRLKAELNDGRAAVELVQFARTFGVEFDTTALTKHLERAEMLGGLSPQELNAKVLLLQHLRRYSELASFIDENWRRLIQISPPEALGGMLIQAYVEAKEFGRAEEALAARSNVLFPLDIPRFHLMISHGRGEDPTRQARDNFAASGAIEDLANLIQSLENRGRWTELAPYASEMFRREANATNALRHIACLRMETNADEEIVRFLDEWPDLITRDFRLMSAHAWALFHLGRVDEARRLNDQLLESQHRVTEIGLDINLAVRMGDWERLPAILEREWQKRDELPVEMLLHLAKLTSSSAKERALQLVSEAASREPDNPRSLLQAYSVASAMARDDIAMPLVNRAAQLSKEADGLVKSMSLKEIAEMMEDSANDWRKKNELFRSGSIPIHWAARVFNVPLSRLLIAIPRENKDQQDARRRQPIPTRSGRRRRVETSAIKRLAIDLTSAFLLSELNFLQRLVDSLDEILLSPRFMEILLLEKEKVRFHQPSRIEAAIPMLDLLKKELLSLVESVGTPNLIKEVGAEEAALLTAAKLSGGLCIHAGKLYRAGSYMDEEAELGELASRLSSPATVARALHDEGFITAVSRDKALEYLERVSSGEMSGAPLMPGVPVFLDRVSTQYLSEAGILGYLVKSNRRVFVHPGAAEEWQALVATAPHSEAMAEALENIRRTLRDGMSRRKVRFLREGKSRDGEDRFETSELLVIDLLEDVSQVDGVCIDDRLLNNDHLLEDRNGKKVDLLCSLDVIDLLVERQVVTAFERLEAIHTMREWCLCALPLEGSELSILLSEKRVNEAGVLAESAQLRVIREYLARLHSSDFLCAPSDLDYLDELWRTGQRVINQIWLDNDSNLADVIARADWVVDHIIPDIELALRFAPDGRGRMEEIAVSRLATALLPFGVADGTRAAHVEWLGVKIIEPLLPACSQLVDKVAGKMSAWVMDRSREIANEIGIHDSRTDAQVSAEGNSPESPK